MEQNPARKAPDVKSLKTGMTVYLLPRNTRKNKQGAKEAVIVKIGRRYVSVKRIDETICPVIYKFDIADNYLEKTGKYGREYDLFFSQADVEDHILHGELEGIVNSKIGYACYLTTHQLKQIADLLQKGERQYKSGAKEQKGA